MNSWWLRLYTIPHLKKHLTSLGSITALNVILVLLKFKQWPWALLLYLYPFFSFIGFKADSLRANLDFHRNSIALPQLQRAVYMDLAIQLVVFVLSQIIGFLTPILLQAYISSRPEVLLTLVYKFSFGFLGSIFSPSVFLTFLVTAIAFVVSIKNVGGPHQLAEKMKKSFSEEEKKKKRKRGLIFFGVLFSYYGLGLDEDFSIPISASIIALWTFLSASFYSQYFSYRTDFHHEKSFVSPKRMFLLGVFPVGAVTTFLLCMGLLSRFEVTSSNLPVGGRILSLYVFEDFAPVLDVDTVSNLLKGDYGVAEGVWKHADPEAWVLPLNQIYSERNLYVWYQYLVYGKPSEQNLVHMMRELETHPDAKDWIEPRYYHHVQLKLVKLWPAAKDLPKDLKRELKEVRKPAADPQKQAEEKKADPAGP